MRHHSILVTIITAVLLGCLAGFQGCDRSSEPEIRNVLLICMDTTRADHLSCYGYPHLTTPNIDRLASEGALFTHAITPVPQTLPAHISMLSGTIPPYHGIHDNHDYSLDPSLVTIPEILKSQGFSTAALLSDL